MAVGEQEWNRAERHVGERGWNEGRMDVGEQKWFVSDGGTKVGRRLVSKNVISVKGTLGATVERGWKACW